MESGASLLESALTKAAELVPALIVLVFVVIMFLRHLREESQARREYDKTREQERAKREDNRDQKMSSVILSAEKTMSGANEALTRVTFLLDRKDRE